MVLNLAPEDHRRTIHSSRSWSKTFFPKVTCLPLSIYEFTKPQSELNSTRHRDNREYGIMTVGNSNTIIPLMFDQSLFGQTMFSPEVLGVAWKTSVIVMSVVVFKE
jgi:hypothetical protein